MIAASLTRLGALLRSDRRTVLGLNRRNLDFVLRRNPRRHYRLADDKLEAKRLLSAAGVPVAPTLRACADLRGVRRLESWLSEQTQVVIKPARGRAGRGILVLRERSRDGFVTAGGRELSMAQVLRHVADIVYGVYSYDRADTAVLEPMLRPSPFFAALFEQGLSDLRVIVVDEQPAIAMIRVPTRASDGRANLHQGALGLGVCLEDGRVHRAWLHGEVVERHPDSNAPVTGQQVPDWPEIMDVCARTARAVPLRYLGIDLVVDRTLGPLVLEINVRPGLEIQNVNGTPLGTRFREMGVG